MDILEEIIAHKQQELASYQRQISEKAIHQAIEPLLNKPQPSLKATLSNSSTGIIAEFKRKSPSKGWINQHARANEVVTDYEKNGAAAISILTDEAYFGGNESYIAETRKAGVKLPILYKNFIIDEYQLFQARYCGASAILLIAAVLNKQQCKSLIHTAHEIGLEVLLEMHNERETEYADLEPDVCGINNRCLGTFITDVDTSLNLIHRLPQEVCKISESGISNAETAHILQAIGYNGFLIGENFMKQAQPGLALKRFIEDMSSSSIL